MDGSADFYMIVAIAKDYWYKRGISPQGMQVDLLPFCEASK